MARMKMKAKYKVMNKTFTLFVALWILMSGMVAVAQKQANVNYVHDAAGQLVGSIDANGEAKAYTYDAAGRLVSIGKLVAQGDVDIFFVTPNRGRRPPPEGTLVTIYGVGFSELATDNQVTFNGVAAQVVEASTTKMQTRVPAGATTGRVRVTSPAGEATSRSDFIVTNVCADRPSGLVSWWPAEGNANDIIGTNHGTVQGGVTFVPGMVGQAFNFDGTTGSIRIPASPSLNVGLGNGFTVEAWVSPSDAERGSWIEWNNESSGDRNGVHIWIGSGVVVGCSDPGTLYANIIGTDGGFRHLCSPGRTIRIDTFSHIALTYDRTTGLGRLYRNGAVVAEGNFGAFTPQTSHPLFFGARPRCNECFAAGRLDEVDLFNRALSQAEIQALYRAGANGKCRP